MRYLDEATLVRYVEALVTADRYDWDSAARPEQTEPAAYRIWTICSGRGWGKTRTGSELVRKWATEGRGGKHLAVVAKGHRELRDVCFEAKKAGLLAVIPPEMVTNYYKGMGDTRIHLSNGTIIRGFSSQDPDALRGYAFDGCWMDEYAAYHRKVAQDVYDNLWFCMRESARPRMAVTTTPKRVQHVITLLKRADWDSGMVLTRGRTRDNEANLSPDALEELEAQYANTRLGRQELEGELLEDVEGALWTFELIEAAQWREELPSFDHVITAVDPSGSPDGDATGVVTVAIDTERRLFIVADDTTQGPPEHRYETACLAAARHGASRIVYESAYGGDNVALGIRNAWKHLMQTGQVSRGCPAIWPSNIAGDKVVRAEPVVGLFEQQLASGMDRVMMAPGLEALSDEMTGWEPASGVSPNRIDAMVHGLRHLMTLAGRRGLADVSSLKVFADAPSLAQGARSIGTTGRPSPFGGAR